MAWMVRVMMLRVMQAGTWARTELRRRGRLGTRRRRVVYDDDVAHATGIVDFADFTVRDGDLLRSSFTLPRDWRGCWEWEGRGLLLAVMRVRVQVGLGIS